MTRKSWAVYSEEWQGWQLVGARGAGAGFRLPLTLCVAVVKSLLFLCTPGDGDISLSPTPSALKSELKAPALFWGVYLPPQGLVLMNIYKGKDKTVPKEKQSRVSGEPKSVSN